MATNNNSKATALAPIGATKAVSPSPIARDQQVAFAIAAMPSRKGETYSIDALRVRLMAAGAPLALPWGKGDWGYMVRNPRPVSGARGRLGATHAFANSADKGARERCIGHDKGDACDVFAVSTGDSVRRFAHDTVAAYAADTLPHDNKALAALAAKHWRAHVAYLRTERKASDAAIAATPCIAQAIAAGFALPTRSASKPASKATKPVAASPASE